MGWPSATARRDIMPRSLPVQGKNPGRWATAPLTAPKPATPKPAAPENGSDLGEGYAATGPHVFSSSSSRSTTSSTSSSPSSEASSSSESSSSSSSLSTSSS